MQSKTTITNNYKKPMANALCSRWMLVNPCSTCRLPTAISLLLCLLTLAFGAPVRGLEPQFGFGQSQNNSRGTQGGMVTDIFNNNFSQAIPRLPPTPFPSSGFDNNTGSYYNAVRPDLRLGAQVSFTDVGAQVTQVEPRSAAQIAGISQGDVIVAVGGYQVGYIDNRLYDLEDEVPKRTTPDGKLTALILSRQSGRLQAIQINMQAAAQGGGGISGRVNLRDQPNLPYGSMLTIQLQNLTRPFYEVNGGQLTQPVSGNGPFPFQINFDPRYIDRNDQYGLTAYISVNGQTYYAMQTALPVNLNAPLAPLNIVLERPIDRAVVQAGATTQVNYPPSSQTIIELYRKYLGKSPNSFEMQAWTQHLSMNHPISDLESSLLASPGFYERAGGRPPQFIQSLYNLVLGRQANSSDIDAWERKLNQLGGSRLPLVQEFLKATGR